MRGNGSQANGNLLFGTRLKTNEAKAREHQNPLELDAADKAIQDPSFDSLLNLFAVVASSELDSTLFADKLKKEKFYVPKVRDYGTLAEYSLRDELWIGEDYVKSNSLKIIKKARKAVRKRLAGDYAEGVSVNLSSLPAEELDAFVKNLNSEGRTIERIQNRDTNTIRRFIVFWLCQDESLPDSFKKFKIEDESR